MKWCRTRNPSIEQNPARPLTPESSSRPDPVRGTRGPADAGTLPVPLKVESHITPLLSHRTASRKITTQARPTIVNHYLVKVIKILEQRYEAPLANEDQLVFRAGSRQRPHRTEGLDDVTHRRQSDDQQTAAHRGVRSRRTSDLLPIQTRKRSAQPGIIVAGLRSGSSTIDHRPSGETTSLPAGNSPYLHLRKV